MTFKHIVAALLTVGALMVPHSLAASDFEWRLSLNLRAHSDPYGYRYGLANRFGRQESDVLIILNRVYEPADAYMIFRLAELSGHSPEYVLSVYHQRRLHGWNDIAYVLGIDSAIQDFIVFRERHDMRDVYYDYRRKERYEERYRAPIQHHYAPPPKHHAPKPHRHDKPQSHATPTPPNHPKSYNHPKPQEPTQQAMHHHAKPQPQHHPKKYEEYGRHR